MTNWALRAILKAHPIEDRICGSLTRFCISHYKPGGDTVSRRALITGITGQDGSYLAELLLSKGYEVHGIIRRASTFNTSRIDHVYQDPHGTDRRLFLHYGDLSTSEQLTGLIYNMRPDEIYHLGAQSHVRVSFDVPSLPATLRAWEPRGFSRLFGRADLHAAITKRGHRKCSAPRHRLNARTRHFTRVAPTAPQSCMATL